jgi:Uma2 family endonuclease
MAEPARKTPHAEKDKPDSGFPEDEPVGITLLQRWVERPDGRLELREFPLTPEDFLNPRYGDKWLQGRAHSDFVIELAELLKRHFRSQPELVVMSDVQHRLAPGLDKPCPDVSVVRGVADPSAIDDTFDAVKLGVRPCLVIEVVSPKDARIRRVDEKDKVRLYERAGIPEYLLIRPPLPGRKQKLQIWGYRLGPAGRYQPIGSGKEGRLLSEQSNLLFGISPAGDRLEVVDTKTGRRLRTPIEIEEAQQAAEEELARLRAELERAHTQL